MTDPAPSHLSESAAEIWCQVVAELGADGWAGERRLQLEIFCCERARWLDAERDLAADGAVVVTRNDKGEVKGMQTHPAVAVSERARRAMVAAWRLLGPQPQADPGQPALTYDPASEFDPVGPLTVVEADFELDR